MRFTKTLENAIVLALSPFNDINTYVRHAMYLKSSAVSTGGYLNERFPGSVSSCFSHFVCVEFRLIQGNLLTNMNK